MMKVKKIRLFIYTILLGLLLGACSTSTNNLEKIKTLKIEKLSITFLVDKNNGTLKFTNDKKTYYDANQVKDQLSIDQEYYIYCDATSTTQITYHGESILPVETFEWTADHLNHLASVYVLNKKIDYQFSE